MDKAVDEEGAETADEAAGEAAGGGGGNSGGSAVRNHFRRMPWLSDITLDEVY